MHKIGTFEENGHDHLAWKELPKDIESIAITSTFGVPEKFVVDQCTNVPICLNSVYRPDVFTTKETEKYKNAPPYIHSRHGNPTRDVLQTCLAKMEGAKYALAYSSGSAAMSNVFHTFLKQGDHAICFKPVYEGALLQLRDMMKFGIEVDYSGWDIKQVVSKIKPNTRIIWLESISNPTLDIVDMEELVKACKAKNSNLLICVDNTFATCIYHRPLDYGVDIVMYSCSKYNCGTGDIFQGSLSVNSDELYKPLLVNQELFGAIPSPFDCYGMLRSLKTLPLRMEQHSKNSMAVAKFLETHPAVLQVRHPGLKSHPQHHIALKQQSGPSGVVGFYIKGGLKEAQAFVEALKVIRKTPSLGIDFSIANIAAYNSHPHLPKAEKDELGITENYIRVSVGLENAKTLMQDLDQALAKATGCDRFLAAFALI